MKTNGYFTAITDPVNLHRAYDRARKGKRYRPEVTAFDYRHEEHLWQLHHRLRAGTYRPGDYFN